MWIKMFLRFIQLFYGGLDNKEFRYSNIAVLHLHLWWFYCSLCFCANFSFSLFYLWYLKNIFSFFLSRPPTPPIPLSWKVCRPRQIMNMERCHCHILRRGKRRRWLHPFSRLNQFIPTSPCQPQSLLYKILLEVRKKHITFYNLGNLV